MNGKFIIVADDSQEIDNTTCVEMHQHVTDGLDNAGTPPPPIEEIAVGSGTATPSESDTSLSNEIARAEVIGYEDLGDTIEATAIFGSQTGNGTTFAEVGAYAGDYFLNHALLSSTIQKDSSITVEITVQFSYDAA